jgi:hypothetical protein
MLAYLTAQTRTSNMQDSYGLSGSFALLPGYRNRTLIAIKAGQFDDLYLTPIMLANFRAGRRRVMRTKDFNTLA